jgi:hypothetical protein
MLRKFGSNTPLTEELVRIADAEFAWVVEQQTHLAAEIDAQEKLAELRDALRRKARCYLDHLHEFHWTEHEPGRPRTEKRQPRPLAEFGHLFALEAFIARTGE